MTEQLVSFNTARLAKLKGFNELCGLHYSYGNGDSAEPETGGVYIGGFLDDGMKPRKYNNTELGKYDWSLPYGNFSAPTQGFLQKWLREVHNIHIWINTGFQDGEIYYEAWVDIFKNKKFKEQQFNVEMYSDKYEEALELGLQEALNLL